MVSTWSVGGYLQGSALLSTAQCICIWNGKEGERENLAKLVNNVRPDWEELQKDLVVMNDWVVKRQVTFSADECRGEIQPRSVHTAGGSNRAITAQEGHVGVTGVILWKYQCSAHHQMKNQIKCQELLRKEER